MTINVVMAVILRYFTELEYDVVVKQLPRFQNILLIGYDHIKTICAIIQRLFLIISGSRYVQILKWKYYFPFNHSCMSTLPLKS